MKVKCKSCDYDWDTKTNNPRCPKCGSSKITAVLPEDEEENEAKTKINNVEDRSEAESSESLSDINRISLDTSMLDNKNITEEALEDKREMEKGNEEESKIAPANYKGVLALIIPGILDNIFKAINKRFEEFEPLSKEEKNDLSEALRQIEFEMGSRANPTDGTGLMIISATGMITNRMIPIISIIGKSMKKKEPEPEPQANPPIQNPNLQAGSPVGG